MNKQNFGSQTPIEFCRVDRIVYSILSSELIEGTNLKQFDHSVLIIKKTEEDPNDSERILVAVLDANSKRIVQLNFKKHHHFPKETEGEFFFDEQQALEVLRKLATKEADKAKKAYEAASSAQKLYDEKLSIAPEGPGERRTITIVDSPEPEQSYRKPSPSRGVKANFHINSEDDVVKEE